MNSHEFEPHPWVSEVLPFFRFWDHRVVLKLSECLAVKAEFTNIVISDLLGYDLNAKLEVALTRKIVFERSARLNLDPGRGD